MTQTATITQEPQRMRALERANEVRLARARLKRKIADGQVSAAYVILELPWEAANWPVGEVLMSQRRWGSTRARKLLSGLQISEKRTIGNLTERQRRLLAGQLGIHERPDAGVAARGSHVCEQADHEPQAARLVTPSPVLELVGV